MLRAVTPMNPARDRPVRATPPFVLNSQTIGPDNPRFGQTEIGWLTGAAGWMFRALLERVAGVRPEVDGLRIAPCVPPDWDGLGLHRVFRGARYEIAIDNMRGAIANPRGAAARTQGAAAPGSPREILVDGRPLAGNLVPAADPGTTIRVSVRP